MTAPVLDVTNPESANAIGVDLESDARTLAIVASSSLTIGNVEGVEIAVRDRQQIADLSKRVADYFAPLKSMAYALHKSICARENAILTPLATRDRAIRDAIADFKREQDRQRLKAEREESERRHREEQATAVNEAAVLEASGESDLAAAIVENAIATPAPVVALPDVVRSVPGLKFRKVWKWKYADGPDPAARVPRAFLMVDEVKVGAYVRSMKSSGSIPGIDIYSVDEPVR